MSCDDEDDADGTDCVTGCWSFRCHHLAGQTDRFGS